jgi:hemoglobin-like flavoprotein
MTSEEANTSTTAADLVNNSFSLTESAANADPEIAEQNRKIAEEKKAYDERVGNEEGKSGNELVVETWDTVKAIPDYQKVAGEILFRRVFELNPDATDLFSFAKGYKATDDEMYKDVKFVRHATGVVATVTAAVNLLKDGDMDTLVSVLKDLGAKHAKFNLVEAHFDLVGASLLYTLEKALAEAFTPKVKEAWVGVYGVIAEQMMLGAEESKA